MKEKVIFDTNTIRNTDINNFFGGRKELEQFENDADIIVPYTVIEEIKRQKKVILKSKKDSFLSNPLHRIMGIDEDNTKAFDVEAYIKKLEDDETIVFEVIDLKANDVLPQIKELALLKKPPFVEADDSDKGFKDALIYFSVLEYVQEIPNKYVFVCTKDNLLKRAFLAHSNIVVVESYTEFKEHSVSQFFDDYFIQKVNAELGVEISKENIKEYWYNINDNKVVLVGLEEQEYVIETDSGEIISTCNRSQFQINTLINSSSFRMTHRSINELENYTHFLSNDEVKIILEASYSNQEIRLIINDSDVKEFLASLYNTNMIEDNDAKNFLKEIFE
ncbi:PIN domain-containing protein [Epilithonimonas xixisoli]|uniref:PIN domain-containing protein n=1 Tax=Epilithonimonas xixisoli TaxID=1476462 RepID=A0A4R8I927_9FLAO|nr:PIN domain-containing protein [Epilithonimonas xixisoli]TDX86568.1 PIN domain-containing protein [Epilithonimonas xixisoli]